MLLLVLAGSYGSAAVDNKSSKISAIKKQKFGRKRAVKKKTVARSGDGRAHASLRGCAYTAALTQCLRMPFAYARNVFCLRGVGFCLRRVFFKAGLPYVFILIVGDATTT